MKSTDPRYIHVALWDLPNGETVRVTVRYPTLGLERGTERAYTLHVQPLTFERGDGYTVECYSPHRGYRMRLEALAEDPAVRDLARGMFDRCAADVGGAA